MDKFYMDPKRLREIEYFKNNIYVVFTHLGEEVFSLWENAVMDSFRRLSLSLEDKIELTRTAMSAPRDLDFVSSEGDVYCVRVIPNRLNESSIYDGEENDFECLDD